MLQYLTSLHQDFPRMAAIWIIGIPEVLLFDPDDLEVFIVTFQSLQMILTVFHFSTTRKRKLAILLNLLNYSHGIHNVSCIPFFFELDFQFRLVFSKYLILARNICCPLDFLFPRSFL